MMLFEVLSRVLCFVWDVLMVGSDFVRKKTGFLIIC